MSRAHDPALEVIRHFKAQLPAGLPVYAAIGVFDGVHLGHQELLRRVITEARDAGAVSCVLTFQPHPLAVVNGGVNAPALLTSLADRLFLLGQTGIQRVLVVPFTQWFAQLEPEDFVRQILHEELGISRVYVGFSFTFGRYGRGTPALLRQLGTDLGIEVVECAPVSRNEEIISSTQIRQALLAGDVRRAALSLGRPHVVEGTVVKGDARGRQLGFPTANIPVSGPIIWPANGVYAVRVCLQRGETLGGVANLGRRPTIASGGHRLLEVHLLDFQGDLYGQKVRVGFLEFIRGERRFAGLEELKQQIAHDVDRAVTLLNQDPGGQSDRYLCFGQGRDHIYRR